MDKIKIAIDSCLVTMLSQLASENLSDKDKAVIDCLKRKVLTPSLYEGVDSKALPSILKDTYFGKITEGEDGKKYYSNLMDTYRLWQKVEKGIVELYITPTVFGELDFEWLKEQRDFINKYVKVIQVKDEDVKLFYAKRGLLAREYVKVGAMSELYSASVRKKVPENDAFIMAEASLCGLMLVTINEKDFINSNRWTDDHKRGDAIQEVNKQQGLIFQSNLDIFKIAPHPMTVHSFAMKSRYNKMNCTKGYYIVNPRLEDKVYKQELSK